MILDETRVLIRTENMTKGYKQGNDIKEAIGGLDIRIMQGEFVIIEGLSGRQKNAFFNLIGCLEKPDTGKYYFDYEDIALAEADMLDNIRKNKIGYLFRNFKLIARLTAAENIVVPMGGLTISQKEKKDRLKRSLKSFDIEDIAEEKAGNLSDWEKQLISLARAVVNEPLMIIADEPSENLDSKEEQKLMEHLFRLNSEGIAIILITEKAEVKALDRFRLISFKAGRISKEGGLS